MKLKKDIIQIFITFTIFFMMGTSSIYAGEKKKAPKDVVVTRYNNRALKLKWKKQKDVDGYLIYRYDKKTKKYKHIKTIKGNNHTEYVNKKLKTNKIYRYKLAAYKKINQRKIFSKKSGYVMAKAYQRDKVKINAREPKVSNRKVYLGLCSSKKIKIRVLASKYGMNENKRAFSTKVRWYSSNNKIAKVDKNGKITAGTIPGKCNIYAVAHNGRRTKIKVVVKNYARAKRYYNCDKEEDLYTLVYEYTDIIQDIAEYFSVNRLKGNETINIGLNNEAKVVVEPKRKFDEKISREIEDLLVNFPYYLSINIDESEVAFISRKEDTDEALPGYVNFVFDNDCSQWSSWIAPHWEAVRFYPI